MQDVFAFGARPEAVHCSEVTSTGAFSAIEVVAEEPLRLAVITALWLDENEPEVDVKLTPLLPAGTVTDVGTFRLLELELSVTITPPLPAAPLRLT